MKNLSARSLVCTLLVAAGAGASGFAAATNAADDTKPHAHEAAMKEQMQMMKGPQGAAMMRDAMLMMAAHQHLLGEMAASPEVKKAAQDPQMMKAIQEVKGAMKQRGGLDAKKVEVAKDHMEAMMVLAHALMKQDKELDAMLKHAEQGKEHHAQ